MSQIVNLEIKQSELTISPPSISKETVEKQLSSKAIETIKDIVADTSKRMQGHKANIQLLNSGIFYPNEYFKALKATNQTARLNFFLNKGSFYHGYLSPKHFEMVKNDSMPTGVQLYFFVLKKGVKPSEALAALRRGPSLIGCGETCEVAYFEAIKDVLGIEKFDLLFSAESSTPLRIDYNSPTNPLVSLIQQALSPKTLKGRIVHIVNTPYYPIKHLNGEARGFNAIVCNETAKLETVTTIGLKPEGSTFAETNETLLQEFNDEPIGMAIVTQEVAQRIIASNPSEKIRLAEVSKNAKITMEEFKHQGGGEITFTIEFNAMRITDLANSSLKKARELFNQWTKN